MSLVHLVIQLYIYVLLASALLSWFPTNSSSGALATTKRILADITNPVLRPLRRILPQPQFGGVGIDLSVLVAMIGLEIINSLI